MPTIPAIQIMPPTDWQEFQRLCADLWKRIWKNTNIQEYGAIGQRQNGVDIHGLIGNGKKCGGVQCKNKNQLAGNKLTIEELRSETKKAKKFSPKLREYVIAYTGQRDVKLQDEAKRLTQNNRNRKLFNVIVYSWDDILLELTNHPDLLQKYYPAQFGSTVAPQVIIKDVVAEVATEIRSASQEFGKELKGIAETVGSIRQEIKVKAHSELSVEIAYSKKLIDSYKPKTCLEYVDELIGRHWDEISDKSKFKLLTNKASALVKLGRSDEAGPMFIRALQYSRDDEKAFTNAAFGYIIVEDGQEAMACISKAIHKNPMNLQAWTLRIDLCRDVTSLEEIMRQMPRSLQRKPDINWARGVVLQRLGKTRDSVEFMELALKQDKEKRIDLLVQAASINLKEVLEDSKPNSRMLKSQTRSKLLRIESLFDDALKRMAEGDIIPIRIQAVKHRGITRRILGRIDDARKDLDQAIEWEPEDFEAVKQRSILSAEEDKYDEAIRLLKPFAERENSFEARMILADTYRMSKNTEKAVDLLTGSDAWKTSVEVRIHALMIITECFIDQRDRRSALASVEKIKQLLPTSFVPFAVQARVERVLGDVTKAKEVALTAKTILGSEIDFFDEWRLADELFSLELYSDAADIYSRIADPEQNDPLTGRLIESCYRSDQWEKALEHCATLRKTHPSAQIAVEIASVILESIGDLQGSIQILREFLKVNPDHYHSRLRLATVLWRSGKMVEAEAELSKIDDANKLGPREVLNYSSLLNAKGDLEGSIKVLFAARKKYSNDADIDMAYISIIFGRGEHVPILENPATVCQDSVVVLESDEKEREFYIIEDRPDPDFTKREINLKDPIAEALLGKAIDDKVVLEKNPFQQRFWTIRSIKSKYSHALHEALNTHSKRFPDRHDFHVFTTPTDEHGKVDAEALRKQMLATLPDEVRQDNISKLYKQRKLTIGSLAKLAGRDVLATTVHLATYPELGIYSSNGSDSEYRSAIESIDPSKGLVVEATAIIVVELLKLRDLVAEKYGPLIISQSTLDEFEHILAQRSFGGNQPGLSIFKEQGQLYKHEVSLEEKQKHLENLRSLIDWLRNTCEIRPVKVALTLKRSQKEEMDELLGAAAFDSILLAEENNVPLYAEDGMLRALASHEHKVRGVWTHALMKHAFAQGYISNDRYEEDTISLLSMNVHHVSINSHLLISAAKKSAWRVDYKLASVLFNLTGVRCNENSAIVVVGESIYSIWTETLSPLNKNSLVFALLDAVTTARRRDIAIKKLEAFLSNKFHLWPQALAAVIAIIDSWKKARMM